MKASAKPQPAAKKAAGKRGAKQAGGVPATSRAKAVKGGSAELVVEPATPAAPERVKLVRDSFTMPRDEFDLIARLKARALEFRRPTKKSELLRAGLQQLAALDAAQLQAALSALRPLQTGRPKKKR